LSLLLKNSQKVGSLSLYDIAHTPGVAADLSHIETRSKVSGHMGPEQLQQHKFSYIFVVSFIGGGNQITQ
jgi:malate dehydrogenase